MASVSVLRNSEQLVGAIWTAILYFKKVILQDDFSLPSVALLFSLLKKMCCDLEVFRTVLIVTN